jgi:hypothetical protein
MVYTANASLGERPESLYGVHMNIPAHVNMVRVIDSFMLVSLLGQPVIRPKFVSIDGSRSQNPFLYVGQERSSANVRDCHGYNFALSLNHAKHWCFVRGFTWSASWSSSPASTYVGLVKFNLTAKRLIGLFHQFLSDFLCHAPGRFVSDPKLTLQLFSGYSASGASHQVHGVEPQMKRSRGLVEDGSSGRVDVVTAPQASPRLALLSGLVPLELPLLLALGAVGMGAIGRIAVAPEPFKASFVVGKLPHELHQGVLRFGRFLSSRILSISRRHY